MNERVDGVAGGGPRGGVKGAGLREGGEGELLLYALVRDGEVGGAADSGRVYRDLVLEGRDGGGKEGKERGEEEGESVHVWSLRVEKMFVVKQMMIRAFADAEVAHV